MNQVDSSSALWGNQHRTKPRARRNTGSTMATACDQCHRCKVKCSGGKPSCDRCQSYESICTYSLGKPLGKPPKNATRKPYPLPSQPQPLPNSPPYSAPLPLPPLQTKQFQQHTHERSKSHAGIEFDFNVASAPITRIEEKNIRTSNANQGENRGTPMGRPNQPTQATTRRNPDSQIYGDAESYLQDDCLFSPLDNTINFFNGTENSEDMNLDFFTTDFCADFRTEANQKDSSSSHDDVVMTSNERLETPVIPTPPSSFSAALSNGRESPGTRTHSTNSFDKDKTDSTKTVSVMDITMTPCKDNEQQEESHPECVPILEMTLRLYFQTSSNTQYPISETLRLARQGLQAVQQHIPKFLPTEFTSEPNDSSILTCILLMDQVLLCYDSLLKRPLGLGYSGRKDTSSPCALSAALSPNSPPNHTTLQHHKRQRIFIGDFEVQGKASWKVILDAVVQAEMQEAQGTVSKLEQWAKELNATGDKDGNLALDFLEPLKQKSRD